MRIPMSLTCSSRWLSLSLDKVAKIFQLQDLSAVQMNVHCKAAFIHSKLYFILHKN